MTPHCSQTKRGRLSSGGVVNTTGWAHSEQNFMVYSGDRIDDVEQFDDARYCLTGAKPNTMRRLSDEVYHCTEPVAVVAIPSDTLYISPLQARGGAAWQLVGLITRRSQVQILPPQPSRVSARIENAKIDSAARAKSNRHQIRAVALLIMFPPNRRRRGESVGTQQPWVT